MLLCAFLLPGSALAAELTEAGAHIIGLKDMAGLVKPDAARLLMERDTREAMAAMHAGRELGDLERVRNRRDQAYLVRAKGWQRADLSRGLVDSAVGITVLCALTLTILWTAASPRPVPFPTSLVVKNG